MANVIDPSLDGTGVRVGIVVSRYNEFFTRHLLDACTRQLQRSGVKDRDVTIAWVPGSMELATVARELVVARRVDVAVCLGCIIRGETSHYDHVASESAHAIARVALETHRPVIYGVVTAETIEQAVDRAGARAGNRGADAAVAAIEMAQTVGAIRRFSWRRLIRARLFPVRRRMSSLGVGEDI